MPVDLELEQTIAAHLSAGARKEAATVALQGLGPQILGYIHANLRDEDATYDVFGHFSEELWKSVGTFRADSVQARDARDQIVVTAVWAKPGESPTTVLGVPVK